jgi:hypothetical protein
MSGFYEMSSMEMHKNFVGGKLEVGTEWQDLQQALRMNPLQLLEMLIREETAIAGETKESFMQTMVQAGAGRLVDSLENEAAQLIPRVETQLAAVGVSELFGAPIKQDEKTYAGVAKVAGHISKKEVEATKEVISAAENTDQALMEFMTRIYATVQLFIANRLNQIEAMMEDYSGAKESVRETTSEHVQELAPMQDFIEPQLDETETKLKKEKKAWERIFGRFNEEFETLQRVSKPTINFATHQSTELSVLRMAA